MGLGAWFAKKTVAGMVHAVCITYRELKSNTSMTEAELCQEVVRRRLMGGPFSGALMDFARRSLLELQLPTVKNLEDACCLVLTLETTTRKNCPVTFEECHEIIRNMLDAKGLLPAEGSD